MKLAMICSDGADFVDLTDWILFPVQEVPAGWFLDGREHAVAHIAFVPDPVFRVQGQKNLGFPKAKELAGIRRWHQ